ncbi:MAG: GumC family protein [Gammaproteobacteria bacterium]
MDQEFKFTQEYIAILKRYKYTIVSIVTVGVILSIIVAFQLPHIYKSTATILIEQEGMPENVVQSMVTDYVEQRIQIINQKIMSSDNLKKIINKFNLYQEDRDERDIHLIVEEMRDDIHIEMLEGMIEGMKTPDPRGSSHSSIGFTLSFEHESPEIAQQVTHELVNLYLNENIKQRAKIVEGATSFLVRESNKLRDEVNLLETKLAKFKENNASNLPELHQYNLNRKERIEQQLIEINNSIRSLTESELYLKSQLGQVNPNATIYSATGERIYGAEDRLIALEAEYTALSSRYSADHPDLVKMRREISALKRETGGIPDKSEYEIKLKEKQTELALLMDRYSPEHPDVKKLNLEIANLKKAIDQPVRIKRENTERKPTNPAYIELKTKLVTAQAELSALLKTRETLNSELLDFEKNISRAPQVEREYQALMRDYENTKAKYNEVKAKQMEATMAQSMEKNKTSYEFSLLEPPLLPEDPFKPNRKAIAFLGLLISMALAVGFVMIKEGLNPSVYTSSRLASVTGVQPLAIIPYLESEQVFLKKQKILKVISFMIGGLLVIAILWY